VGQKPVNIFSLQQDFFSTGLLPKKSADSWIKKITTFENHKDRRRGQARGS
jgi:hypothetical protein